MSIYYVGEFGYEADMECSSKDIAEKAALSKSDEDHTRAIAIWNEFDEVVAVVIDGSVFEKKL